MDGRQRKTRGQKTDRRKTDKGKMKRDHRNRKARTQLNHKWKINKWQLKINATWIVDTTARGQVGERYQAGTSQLEDKGQTEEKETQYNQLQIRER